MAFFAKFCKDSISDVLPPCQIRNDIYLLMCNDMLVVAKILQLYGQLVPLFFLTWIKNIWKILMFRIYNHKSSYIHTTNKIKMIILQMWTSFKIIKICTIRVLWKIVATTCLSYNITSFFSLDILCILNLAFEGFASPIVSIKLYLKDKRISFFMMAEKEVVCYTF